MEGQLHRRTVVVGVDGRAVLHRARVVIGHRGLGGLEGLLVGSVGVGLTVHAHCPVAVVRPDLDAGDSDAP